MTRTEPQEIELKLALPMAQVPAFLKRMARRRAVPLQQELLTRYFDTPDFSLSGEGVALRVRKIGRRWLQTLKTEGERQGGLSRRVEFETPIRGDAPDWSRFPPEALDYVPLELRAQLVPLFETRFHRTSWLVSSRGGAQIEVALDQGEVRAGAARQPLCEIELELKAGHPDALFALALEWAGAFDCLPFDVSKAERGVRLARGVAFEPVPAAPIALDSDMTMEAGFAVICQACLTQFQANLPGLLVSDDAEYVHQARVALRRLSTVLRLARKTCPLPPPLAEGLDALDAALTPAREWDVLINDTLPPVAARYPDPDQWQAGLAALENRRREARLAMRADFMAARPGAWLLALNRWLLRKGWRESAEVADDARAVHALPLEKWARRALRKGHDPIKRGAARFAKLSPRKRHALRIAVKRQRYAAEFFESILGGRREARYVAVLRRAQAELGQANDIRTAWKRMISLRAETGPLGAFMLGWLAAQQAEAVRASEPAAIRALRKARPYWS